MGYIGIIEMKMEATTLEPSRTQPQLLRAG